jgi:hypothetical protein
LMHLPVIALQLFDRAQRLPSLWSRLALFRAALALFVTIPLPFLCPITFIQSDCGDCRAPSFSIAILFYFFLVYCDACTTYDS